MLRFMRFLGVKSGLLILVRVKDLTFSNSGSGLARTGQAGSALSLSGSNTGSIVQHCANIAAHKSSPLGDQRLYTGRGCCAGSRELVWNNAVVWSTDPWWALVPWHCWCSVDINKCIYRRNYSSAEAFLLLLGHMMRVQQTSFRALFFKETLAEQTSTSFHIRPKQRLSIMVIRGGVKKPSHCFFYPLLFTYGTGARF